jgi:hypothetical protein
VHHGHVHMDRVGLRHDHEDVSAGTDRPGPNVRQRRHAAGRSARRSRASCRCGGTRRSRARRGGPVRAWAGRGGARRGGATRGGARRGLVR